MSREFMTGWLLGLKLRDVDPVSAVLAKLPSPFVYDLLIFPLLEAHLARASSGAAHALNYYTNWSSVPHIIATSPYRCEAVLVGRHGFQRSRLGGDQAPGLLAPRPFVDLGEREVPAHPLYYRPV